LIAVGTLQPKLVYATLFNSLDSGITPYFHFPPEKICDKLSFKKYPSCLAYIGSVDISKFPGSTTIDTSTNLSMHDVLNTTLISFPGSNLLLLLSSTFQIISLLAGSIIGSPGPVLKSNVNFS
jgi:hypothetical protein